MLPLNEEQYYMWLVGIEAKYNAYQNISMDRVYKVSTFILHIYIPTFLPIKSVANATPSPPRE